MALTPVPARCPGAAPALLSRLRRALTPRRYQYAPRWQLRGNHAVPFTSARARGWLAAREQYVAEHPHPLPTPRHRAA